MPEAASANPSRPTPSGKRRFSFPAALRFLLKQFVRVYAAALIILIVWVSFRAVNYLVVSLVTPGATPAQISGVPKRLDANVLTGQRLDWLGLQAVENPRTPLSHYHRFDTWFPNDRFNDCTRSGCHSPLPHGQRKELRAFLNMHATSVHCGVCHMEAAEAPLALTWYKLEDGAPSAPPALLRAFAWIAARDAAQPVDASGQQQIVQLLREAFAEAHVEPSLQRIADELHAVRPQNREFARLLEAAGDAIARGLRGAYGAKLALRDGRGKPILGHADTHSAVRAFERERDTSDADRRKTLLAAVHPQKRAAPLHCTDCHRAADALIDFNALGYPPQRVANLTRPGLFTMIETIAEGVPFHMPALGAQPAPRSDAP